LAIKAARDYAHGRITRKELAAAHAAAHAAAWDAARAAARAAAELKQAQWLRENTKPTLPDEAQ
jgi:hypothetical protein